MSLGNLLQSGDWKGEKHVPVIKVSGEVKAGEEFEVNVNIGEAVGHPNELAHHIAWFKVFFNTTDGKFPVEVGSYNFSAHGEEDVFSSPNVTIKLKTNSSGTLFALSYCNIHGLWENSQEVTVK